MRSVLHALVWDKFRYFGWMHLLLLAFCMFPMLIYWMILSVATPDVRAQDPVMHLLEVSMLSFVTFMALLGAGASYGNMTQLYTKPLSNLSIAAWRTIGGTIVLVVQMSLLVGLYNGLFNAGWPLAGAVLFTVAVWSAAQPFFCLAGKSILSMLLTMIPIALMIVWFFTRYKTLDGKPQDWNAITLSETLQLVAVIIFFAWCSVSCVGWARRGEGLPLPAWSTEWFLNTFNFPIARSGRRQPFRSASRALFWYDWRWKGWALTACMLLLVAIIVPVEMVRSPSLASYYTAVCSAYIGTMLPSMIMAVLNGFQLESLQISIASGKSSQLNEIDELGSFQAIRPVTDAELGRSNLWVCLASIGLMTGLWLLLVSPVVVAAISQGKFDQLSAEHRIFVVPLVGAFMWMTTSNITSLTSTGRTKQLGGLVIALALLLAGLLMLLDWMDNKALSTTVLQVLLVLFTLTLAAFAGWALFRSYQLGFVTRGGAVAMLAVGSLVAVIGVCLLPKLDVNSIATLICAAILSVLPWATTPLATRWNRHR